MKIDALFTILVTLSLAIAGWYMTGFFTRKKQSDSNLQLTFQGLAAEIKVLNSSIQLLITKTELIQQRIEFMQKEINDHTERIKNIEGSI